MLEFGLHLLKLHVWQFAFKVVGDTTTTIPSDGVPLAAVEVLRVGEGVAEEVALHCLHLNYIRGGAKEDD